MQKISKEKTLVLEIGNGKGAIAAGLTNEGDKMIAIFSDLGITSAMREKMMPDDQVPMQLLEGVEPDAVIILRGENGVKSLLKILHRLDDVDN